MRTSHGICSVTQWQTSDVDPSLPASWYNATCAPSNYLPPSAASHVVDIYTLTSHQNASFFFSHQQLTIKLTFTTNMTTQSHTLSKSKRASSNSNVARTVSLLSSLTPAFSDDVHYAHSAWPKSRRHLQLRANVLLLFRRQPSLPHDISTVDRTITLVHTTAVRMHNSVSVYVDKHRFTFTSTVSANRFFQLLQHAKQPPAERYDILGKIGEGASGIVTLVERRSDGRHFAMKTIPKYDVFFSDAHLEQLITERIALERAVESGSPFIVRLVDAFETMTQFTFITELASYGDLHAVVASMPKRRLPEDVAKVLFAEAVLGLEDLHRMGYLYRDMKLGNLLISSDGHVRLADFGLAKQVKVTYESSSVSSESSSSEGSEGEEEEFRLVGRTKSFVGTRRYMSPEHLVSGHGSKQGYGAPADVWALGVVLYIMLTGRYPFGDGGGNSTQLFMSIKNDDLAIPSCVSGQARELLEGMLHKDCWERMDLSAVKSSKWLRDIDWINLRQEAKDGVEGTLSDVLKELGVPTIEEELERGELDLDDISEVSCERTVSSDASVLLSMKKNCMCRDKRMDGGELLGFGFFRNLKA